MLAYVCQATKSAKIIGRAALEESGGGAGVVVAAHRISAWSRIAAEVCKAAVPATMLDSATTRPASPRLREQGEGFGAAVVDEVGRPAAWGHVPCGHRLPLAARLNLARGIAA